MNAVATPSRFDELEAAIARMPEPQLEVVSHFDEGVYGRELRIPAGSFLTGKKHRKSCLNIVCGDISVYNDETGEETRITGHAVFSSPPGTRRVGYAHFPTIWVTIHVTDEKDVAKIEEQVIEPTRNPLLTESRKAIA